MPALVTAALLDTSDTGGIVVPLAIIAACVVISAVAIVVARRRGRSASSGADGGDAGAGGAEGGDDWGQGHEDLLAWQTTQGHHVDRWLDAHERTLPELVPGADPAIDAELDQAMANAAGVCPNPEISAMLTGMQDTARATRDALASGDREGATEAHSAYARHRSDAIARMNEPQQRADSAGPGG